MNDPVKNIKIGSIIKHFKRETVDLTKFPKAYLYEIIGYGTNADSGELQVIYKALYSSKGMDLRKNIEENSIWIRSYESFYSEVDHKKYPAIKQKFRFELL